MEKENAIRHSVVDSGQKIIIFFFKIHLTMKMALNLKKVPFNWKWHSRPLVAQIMIYTWNFAKAKQKQTNE